MSTALPAVRAINRTRTTAITEVLTATTTNAVATMIVMTWGRGRSNENHATTAAAVMTSTSAAARTAATMSEARSSLDGIIGWPQGLGAADPGSLSFRA